MKQRKSYVMLAALFISLAVMPVFSATEFQLDYTEPETPVFDLSVGKDIHIDDTSLPFCILYEELLRDSSAQDSIDGFDDWLDAISQTPNLFPEIPDDDNPLNEVVRFFQGIAPEKLLSDLISLPPGWKFDIDIDVGSQEIYFGIEITF